MPNLWLRIQAFWRPFWRFLLWGDTKRKGINKLIALGLVFFGSSVVALFETPGYLYVYALQREIISTPFRFGLVFTGIAAAVWILISLGRALELSGVPHLRVGNELERDADVFRLRLLVQEKDFETRVWLHQVYNADGTLRLPGRFPVELEWSHNPNQSVVHLVKGVSSTVAVAEVQYSETGLVGMLFYTGASGKFPIQMAKGQSLYFELLIDRRPLKPIVRWFRFERTDEAEFAAFPNELPLKSQTIR